MMMAGEVAELWKAVSRGEGNEKSPSTSNIFPIHHVCHSS